MMKCILAVLAALSAGVMAMAVAIPEPASEGKSQ